MIRNEEVYSLN